MTRFLACIVDLLIIAGASYILGILVALLAVLSVDLGSALAMLLSFAFAVCYGMVAEWFWRGQTIGKRLLRLRVIDAHGLKLQFSQVAVRNLLRPVDMLPLFYLVGGVTSLLTRKCQRLGDIAANTVVVRNPRVTEPDVEQLLAGKYNSLRHYPHLEARLRQSVSPGEAAVAMQAILRRDELEALARVELFRELAAWFRAKVEFPPEAAEGIADEQYVRNVLDIVYRKRAPDAAFAAERKSPAAVMI